jgi:hypothetical protein
VKKRSRGSRSRQSRLGSIIKALETRFEGTPSLQLAGQAYTLAELAQLLRQELDATKAVRVAEAARTTAIARERALKQRNEPLLVALENLVRGLYGGDVRVLSEFAMSPPKKPRKIPGVKVETEKKPKATRRVRRAMGKRQKKSAKG